MFHYIYLKLCWDRLGISSMVRQKRTMILIWGKFYPIFVFHYFKLLYFLRIIHYFLMKFYTVALGIILIVITLKQCPPSAGGHFGIFWGPILAYVHIFLDICSIFCYKILCRCSWHNPDVTNTFFFDIMSSSSWGHFRVFWGLFWHITSTFWEPFNIFSWNYVQTCLVFLLRVTALFFSISWSCWGALGGIFGLILENVHLILYNCSIFSHETLYRCSSYNTDYH